MDLTANMDETPKISKRAQKEREKLENEKEEKKKALEFIPTKKCENDKNAKAIKKKGNKEVKDTKEPAKNKPKAPAKKKQPKEQQKRFFESGQDNGNWKKIEALKDKYLTELKEFTGSFDERQKLKKKIYEEITFEYENLISKINKIDEQIATQHLEKAICLETLRTLTEITQKPEISEKFISKEKELISEMADKFNLTEIRPKSIYNFSKSSEILSPSALKDLENSLLNPSPPSQILYRVKTPLSEIPQKPISKSKNLKSAKTNSDLESTGPCVSEEIISDSSECKQFQNPNVKVVIT